MSHPFFKSKFNRQKTKDSSPAQNSKPNTNRQYTKTIQAHNKSPKNNRKQTQPSQWSQTGQSHYQLRTLLAWSAELNLLGQLLEADRRGEPGRSVEVGGGAELSSPLRSMHPVPEGVPVAVGA